VLVQIYLWVMLSVISASHVPHGRCRMLWYLLYGDDRSGNQEKDARSFFRLGVVRVAWIRALDQWRDLHGRIRPSGFWVAAPKCGLAS
jgi:hypothetical protein